uniref:Uncharacterized protein n=1 Tax=Siphoviridae sp. ctr8v12 TaxID=2825685 RepID=A0A8S5QFB2_9CAUD|nr:MAG TPA: hypothetical protein [Siphoviridae sp. ctr8v12]
MTLLFHVDDAKIDILSIYSICILIIYQAINAN